MNTKTMTKYFVGPSFTGQNPLCNSATLPSI